MFWPNAPISNSLKFINVDDGFKLLEVWMGVSGENH